MKVAFYLDNSKHEGINYFSPDKGNPGVGGTEFIIWSISYYLNKMYSDIEVIVIAPIIDTLQSTMVKIKCKEHCDAAKLAKENNVDIFIFRDTVDNMDIFDIIDDLKLNTIMWSHNYQNLHVINKAAKCKYLKRNICVGREQYDKLRDHAIFSKCDYIYNAINFDMYIKYNSIKNNLKENIICYMAAIEPLKGFHNVAKVFSEVQKKVPDAQLYVIGSARLYDTQKELGKYGIAEKSYEEKFIKYLVDDSGNIRKNIKFFGILNGEEKLKIMSKAKVGIANVPGYEETFCLVAVEFEAMGIPTIGGRATGLLDTVDNKKTGILVKSNKAMVRSIVNLLNNQELCNKFSTNAPKFVENKFNIRIVCDEWIRVFKEVVEEKEAFQKIKTENYWHDLKWLRELNRILKNNKLLKSTPSIMEYRHIIANVIKKILRKL